MFRRTDKNLPKDPVFPTNLKDLGFEVNEHGQFVKIGDSSQFFDYFHTDNERANEVRREAMHECIRQTVLSSLASMGVKPAYISGKHGTVLSEEKLDGPHVTILTSDMGQLKTKREIVIVVNDSTQDLGIWSYRLLTRQGGLAEGSAVGLVQKLKAWPGGTIHGQTLSSSDPKKAQDMERTDSAIPGADLTHPDVPGLIILNPGQLLYSPMLGMSMSQATWLARPKSTALDDPYAIRPDFNHVAGHFIPEQHIRSVLEHIVPRLTGEEARIYVVALTMGSEWMLNWLDEKLMADHQAAIGGKLEAIALIQPTHTHCEIRSEALKNFLASFGRSWVISGEPMSKLLSVPDAGLPVIISAQAHDKSERDSQSLDPSHMSTSDSQTTASKDRLVAAVEAITKTNMSLGSLSVEAKANAKALSSSRASDEMMFDFEDDALQRKASSAEIRILKKRDDPAGLKPAGSSDTSTSSLSDASNASKANVVTQRGLLIPDPAKLNPILELQSDIPEFGDLRHADGVLETETKDVTELLSQTKLSDESHPTIAGSGDGAIETLPTDTEDDASLRPYPYHQDAVSCPTFSSGIEDVYELVWPAVMDDVLAFFQSESSHRRMRDSEAIKTRHAE